MRLIADTCRDAALGVRLLKRYPGFSLVAIATLALAIGGNTAVFTLVNALLLTPPAVVDPARLARVHTGQSQASWPLYEDIRHGNDVFTDLAAHGLTTLHVDQADTPARLVGQITSPNYLTVLGVAAQRGRTYTAADDGADPIVLAHHVWQQRFGADPQVVGRTLTAGTRSFQVIGVMPPAFRGLAPPGVRLDFWVPASRSADAASLGNRLVPQVEIVGRLKPDVSHVAATASLRALAGRLRAQHADLPESLLEIEAGSIEGVHAFRGMASLVLPVFAFLALLAVISGFVLVIGCSNIAGLLLGRAAMRQREIGVRLSIGSSRGRLLRQLLTESLVLAAAGGIAGLFTAVGLLEIVRIGLTRLPFPLALDLSPDHRVIGYAIALSTASAMFFGVLPARSALRLDLVSSLKAEGSATRERLRLRRLMVTTQVAVCSALVVWSVLFLRSLGNVHAVNPGFDPDGVVLATIELDRGSIDAANGNRILAEWTRRVEASAGVRSAALAMVVPLALTGREEFDVSLPADAPGTGRRVVANRVSPRWFETVRIPLTAGRDFSWDDRHGAPPVAIVNETLARQFWNGNALGQRLKYGEVTLEIVGVARDSRYRTLGEVTAPLVYLPAMQVYSSFMTLYARTDDLRTTTKAMQDELERLLPGARADVERMTDAVSAGVIPARVGAAATGVFGLLAVGLAALGVYGLVGFSVIQRTREIGIRRAVGATNADILRLVLGHHARLVASGLAVGLTLGVLGASALRAFLTGVGPTDPVALVAAIAIVAGSALAASTLPTRQATRVDPTVALRDA